MCLVCCSNSVRTCSTLASMCSNHVQTARHAVVCCSNTFRTVCSCLAMFEHCSKCLNITHCFVCCLNTVQTVFRHVIHSFPCVRMVFEQFVLVWQSSNTVFKQCLNCALMATTCSKSISFLFSFPFFFVCLFTAIHVRLQAHARPSVTRPHAQTSKFFFFLSFSFFLLFFTVIHFRTPIHTPARPHTHTPIRTLKTPSKCFFFFFCLQPSASACPHGCTPIHMPACPHVHMSKTHQSVFFSFFFFVFHFSFFVYSHPHPHTHTSARPSACSRPPPTVCPFYFLFSLSFSFFLFFTGIHVRTHPQNVRTPTRPAESTRRGTVFHPSRMHDSLSPQTLRHATSVHHGVHPFDQRLIQPFSNTVVLRCVVHGHLALSTL